MAEEVKQEAENVLATDEKKSVKVVVKKRVKKATTQSADEKKPRATRKKAINAEIESPIEVLEKPKKRTNNTKKVDKPSEDISQLLLSAVDSLFDIKQETKKPEAKKTKVPRKKVQTSNTDSDATTVDILKSSNDSNNGNNNEKEIVEKKTKIASRKKNKPQLKKTEVSENNVANNASSEEKISNSVEKEVIKANNNPDKIKNDDNLRQNPKQEEKSQRDYSQNNRRNNTQRNINNNNASNNNNNTNRRNNTQRTNNNNRNKNIRKHYEERNEELNLEENPSAEKLFINDYYCMSFDHIRQIGIELGMSQENIFDYKNQEILTEILKDHCQKGGALVVEGTLEVLPDGYGFLRSSRNSYISGPEDIYVSSNLIKHNALKTGDLVYGQVKKPRDTERFYGLHRIIKVNNDEVIKAKTRPSFDSLIPRFPDERMILENVSGDISTRIIDMFCPIGKGQRSLIVAPPRTGKTVLMQKIANAISENHPEIELIVLLVDERPEEVTDMKDNVRGEVIASTFDEQATRHVQVAEMAIEKAKRMVEADKDVVILLDSITRLARAYNQTVPASGKILSGGVDSNALHKPKRFFGAARNMEGGGSLTIVATALIETGSRMDEVIFEEFKGTGNNEIVLDRRLSDRRIFPSINLKKSGTRRDDLLIPSDEAARIWIVRNAINDMDEVEQTPFLIDKMRKSKNNESFFKSINTAIAK